jgi:hypothetical protein
MFTTNRLRDRARQAQPYVALAGRHLTRAIEGLGRLIVWWFSAPDSLSRRDRIFLAEELDRQRREFEIILSGRTPRPGYESEYRNASFDGDDKHI